jgi:hypothetical protein
MMPWPISGRLRSALPIPIQSSIFLQIETRGSTNGCASTKSLLAHHFRCRLGVSSTDAKPARAARAASQAYCSGDKVIDMPQV